MIKDFKEYDYTKLSVKFIYENELEVINEAGNKIYLNKAYIEYAMLERPSIIIANGSNEGMLTKLLFKKGYGMISGVKDTDLVNVIAEGKKYTLVRKFQTDLVLNGFKL